MDTFPNGFKIPFFLAMEIYNLYFSQFIFIDKYLKFKEIGYFIHYIKFEMCLILRKFPSFSVVKLNLGHNIFNSFLDSKLGFLNVGLRLYILQTFS